MTNQKYDKFTSDNTNLMVIVENSQNSDSLDNSVADSEKPNLNNEEPTENILNESIPDQDLKRKKLYVILGSIAGILIFSVIGFLILNQMKTTEINKALQLGETYLEEGKYEEAILAFDAVITIDAKNVDAYEGKGAAYLGLDDYGAAESQLETAKSINFTNNGKVLMADVYINTARKNEGIALVEEVLNNGQESTKTIILISDLYNQINEYTKVIEILEKRIAITENKEELKKLYDELIPAYIKAGKSEAEILALLEKAAVATGDQSYVQKKTSYIVKKPTLSIVPGEYQGDQRPEILKGNPADKVYYTVDGSNPTIASTEYTNPITLPVGETIIKIIEVNSNGVSCLPIEGRYVIKQAKLSETEFVDALYGGWYNQNKKRGMVFSNNRFFLGSLHSGAGFSGSYEIESTSENGGTIIVEATSGDPDKNGNPIKSQVTVSFDFGISDDNKVKVKINAENAEWNEYTIGESLGNDQYRLSGMGINGGDETITVN